MERLLDDVLVGQQEMLDAIDAVCAQASRIIGRLLAGTTSADAALLRVAVPAEAGAKPARQAPPRKGRRRSRPQGQDGAGGPTKRADAPQDERRRKAGRKISAGKISAGKI